MQIKQKNIESFLVDAFLILGSYFISTIEISTIVFIILIIVTTAIVFIGKKPPKNFFLVILYVISISFLLFGVFVISDFLLIDIEQDISSISLISWSIFFYTITVFVFFILNFSKQKKIFQTILTFTIPILFSILIFSVNYISNKYSGGIGVILLIYLPLRFLMAYKEPAKWYQFIVLIIAGIVILYSFVNSEKNYPSTPIHKGLKTINGEFACSEYGIFENDNIIKITLETKYNSNVDDGEYYFIVTENLEDEWVVDRKKTIEYYKYNNFYHYSDSININRLLYKISGNL